jgi:hypothetical protein
LKVPSRYLRQYLQGTVMLTHISIYDHLFFVEDEKMVTDQFVAINSSHDTSSHIRLVASSIPRRMLLSSRKKGKRVRERERERVLLISFVFLLEKIENKQRNRKRI